MGPTLIIGTPRYAMLCMAEFVFSCVLAGTLHELSDALASATVTS